MLLAIHVACLLAAVVSAVGTQDSGKVEIVIIGAGVSGLSAARYLLESSHKERYNIVVLEARNRAGGRVWTNRAAFSGAKGGDVDCGASWIHGASEQNPIAQLASRNSLETKWTDFNNTRIHFRNGTFIDLNKSDILEKLEKIEEKFKSSKDVSIQAAINASDGELLKDPLFNFLLAADTESNEGASIDMVGTGQYDYYKVYEGGDHVLPQGYDQIVDRLRGGQNGSSPVNVILNSKVTRLSIYDTGVVVQTAANDTFLAHHVIVTLPLGVLKDRTVDIPLSNAKWEAVLSVGVGLLNKFILKFDRVFWDANVTSFGIVAEDITQRGLLTWWMNGYLISGTPTLIGFLSGNSALASEAWSDYDLLSNATANLKAIFGPTTPNATAYYRTRWYSDEFSRGSYSYSSTGTTKAHREELQRQEGLIHFAGEHTSVDHHATVHGAYESGIRAAQEIDKYMQPKIAASSGGGVARLTSLLLLLSVFL